MVSRPALNDLNLKMLEVNNFADSKFQSLYSSFPKLGAQTQRASHVADITFSSVVDE